MEYVSSYLQPVSWSVVQFVPELRTAGEVTSGSVPVTTIERSEITPVRAALGDHKSATRVHSIGWRRPRTARLQRERALSA